MKTASLIIILLAATLPLFAQPNVDVTVTPVNPPIVIPAQGGTFQYITSVVNNGPNQVLIWLWTRAWLHGQTSPGLVITPPSCTPPVGQTVTRQRIQNVPGMWHPGEYTYRVYAGLIPYHQILDSADFTFIKLATLDQGIDVWNASCTGEPFPGEKPISQGFPPLLRGDRGDFLTASPNPFNPTTAISYKLQAASLVSLKVYDTSGRLVTTLVEGWREAGSHQVIFDGSNLASGMYLYSLQTGGQNASGKMLLMK